MSLSNLPDREEQKVPPDALHHSWRRFSSLWRGVRAAPSAQTAFADVSSPLAELTRLKDKFALILIYFSLEAHGGVFPPGKSTISFYHLKREAFLILE